ncbi:putative plant lipid transfer protein/Par allergen [Helianthus annuus]|uniref:Non-specific lipid-transfer protein n=1 Tax=Helianthus annuus TaxID=4232 RepID=A0A251VCK4_HELAN|nr:non-specific lipid-transfer protein Lac s 1 isoform X2 [Helianthus annuus]KAF5816368.1 putative plant lipid transfer protein/Par allergen [Helianthus annuus]KAJ0945634.1 putative plant lipid transfer protein/Par allergen [Helianthus annuus]
MARMVMMGLCVVVTCMVVAAPYAEAVFSCARVAASLRPCLPYLTNGGGDVPPGCCTGILALNASATTTVARQATCNCVQSSISGINFGLAAGLPGMCGVTGNVLANISLNTDCSLLG